MESKLKNLLFYPSANHKGVEFWSNIQTIRLEKK